MTQKTKNEFLKVFPELNKEQQKAIFNTDNPTLIIAGPGTGKTFTLVLRTLFIIASGKAEPKEIILTSFTEKSAFELRDRINQFSKKLNLKARFHELKIGTIHGICETYISKYIKHTELNKNFVVLDELTSSLFINEHADQVLEPFKDDKKYFDRWQSKWRTIGYLKSYFDKITEEIIDPNGLINTGNDFLSMIGESYIAYRDLLFDQNRVDFSFQQRIFYDLLQVQSIAENIKAETKYLLIDEYQDTNFIQEQIALQLSENNNNICVVGDEDQALYRFRGATVRNILEFESHFENCHTIKLLDNYRSHKGIIEAYNEFISSIDWTNPTGKYPFRFPDKLVRPSSLTESPEYPPVISIWTGSIREEADRFADFASYLLKQKVVQDASDIALLLRSVKLEHSEPYINALNRRHIRAFCPRARAYFENDEIKLALACYAMILGFIEDIDNYQHSKVIYEGISLLSPYIDTPLAYYLNRQADKIDNLSGDETIDENVSDFLYQLFAYKPFSDYLRNENSARNLSVFSSLLNSFQTYYHIQVISAKNKIALKFKIFNSFFNLLLNTGHNEFEDDSNPIPKGYVQIMTIHQSKGLEFPVVVVGSLDKKFTSTKFVDRDLQQFCSRPAFEPDDRITKFDWIRSFYVAFSRPQKLLVLTNSSEPKPIFQDIWEGLDQWPLIKKETLKAQKFTTKSPFIPKKSLSLTSHVNVYETCPRQYEFYKEYDFTPSRTGQVLFGTLVHQTIEDIHKDVLDGEKTNPKKIAKDFELNYKGLLLNGLRPIGLKQKEEALKQVINYYQKNKDLMRRVMETEVDVSIEREDYIMSGIVDLLMGKDNKLEVLDFKSQKRPESNSSMIEKYKKQLHLYAYILKERHNKDPERLYLYWTGEEHRKDALMEIDYDETILEETKAYFDKVAGCILNKDFKIKTDPDKLKICKECDFRFYCKKDK
jgi:DNA helicase II / ATP-dependent DNA helicase PcrA